MKVYHNLSEYSPEAKGIVTVGTFDGVHIGHQKLLSTINKLATEQGGESVLLTFSPHPRLVLFPDDNDLKMLNTLEEKIERLRKTGIQHLIIHPFSLEFSRTTVLQYVNDILVDNLNVHKLVIGYDHHFGRNRSGNLKNLQAMAPDYNFEVEEIPAQEIEAVNVSSTKIRTALIDGDVDLANEYLGYTYTVSGEVVPGKEIGREIGFPTANIAVGEARKLIPGNGVYACEILVEGRTYHGMVNIGTKPTITDSEQRHIEANIFNLDEDLYGKQLRISFISRLRDEVKFADIHALKTQLEKDEQAAKSLLAERSVRAD